jgi:hypothetical protein
VPVNGAQIQLDLFDVQGRRIRRLVEGWQTGGDQIVAWDGSDDGGHRVAPGIYLYRLSTGTASLSRRLLLVR